MKMFSKYVYAFFILLSVLSCAKPNKVTQPVGDGILPINMTIKPALDNGYEVTRVIANITNPDYSNSLDLTIEADSASGTFYNLQPGIYQITVEVYDHEDIIASGIGQGEVIAGETTIVEIELEFIDLLGNLEIIVDWAVDYTPPEKILFVGNSYTFYNGGIYTHLKNLVISAHPECTFDTDNATHGGYTLEDHYNDTTTISKIQSDNWDYVILQEQSTRPISQPELLYRYATALDTIITQNGSNTAFFMTWAREYDPSMTEDLAAAYNYIGNSLNAPVSPVGRAFQRALETDPDIELYSTDQSHPNVKGTYLAVCTFYCTFWHESPVGIDYVNDESITEDEKEFLQFIAYETFLFYGK